MSQFTKDLLVVIGLPVGLYIFNIIMYALIWGGSGNPLLGAAMGWILLVLFMRQTYRMPYVRVYRHIMDKISFDVDIDMSRKVEKKDDLKRNPLDD